MCRDCWRSLEPWAGGVCADCGLPLVAEPVTDSAAELCGDCRLEPPAFDTARTFGIYNGTLRQLILRMKFSRRERLGERLGERLAGVWIGNAAFTSLENPLLLPVPLHRSRERERGFNQSLAIARGLRRGLRRAHAGDVRPAISGRLIRVRPTTPQTGLSPAERRENVKGAFAVADPARARGRDVVLIDDVMTTGATLAACAAALKSAGARKVLAMAVARATPQFPDLHDGSFAAQVDGRAGEWT